MPSRILAIAVGLVLLVAAVLKSIDMGLFIRQIKDYDILTHHQTVAVLAWGTIAVQCALATALLVDYRPRLTLALTAFKWVILICATSWAWLTGATQDCGCFGAWMRHTPGVATLINVALLSATIAAFVLRGQASGRRQGKVLGWSVAAAFLAGLALPIVFGFSPADIHSSPPEQAGGVFAGLYVDGLPGVDLSRGPHLVVLFGTDCQHCQEAVPELNALVEAFGLPPLVALCPNGEEERSAFVEAYQPVFPLGQINDNAFWRLLDTGETPRTLMVQDGRILKAWDKTIPDENAVRAQMRP